MSHVDNVFIELNTVKRRLDDVDFSLKEVRADMQNLLDDLDDFVSETKLANAALEKLVEINS